MKATIIHFVWTFVAIGITQTQTLEDEQGHEVIDLKQMKIFRDNITLSGFSSGGSMAMHMHLSHSSYFSGIAVFGQTFYLCGHKSLYQFAIGCGLYGFGFFNYDVRFSIEDARKFEQSNLTDSLDNMKRQKVFIWLGAHDEYISVESSKKHINFYEAVGVPSQNIKYNLFKNASHCFPTKNYGKPCGTEPKDTYYLGNCDYSGALHSLSYILNNDMLAEASFNPDRLLTYNQSEFYSGDIKEAAMGTKGFIYIPTSCETKECTLHFNFHGCNEWDPKVAKQYILNSGFLPVAEGNDIVLIFPLTTLTSNNMEGCWDFFSYLPNIGTRKSPQVEVVERILRRLLDGV